MQICATRLLLKLKSNTNWIPGQLFFLSRFQRLGPTPNGSGQDQVKRLRMACNPKTIWFVGCYNSITTYGQISSNRPCLQCWVKARAHTHSCQQKEEGIPGFQLMTSISYQMYHLKIFFLPFWQNFWVQSTVQHKQRPGSAPAFILINELILASH